LVATRRIAADVATLPELVKRAQDWPRRRREAHRLYGVLNHRLAQHEFVADDYSIADIAIWPWVSRYEWQTVDLHAYANVKRWYRVIARRPAVQRGYKVPKDAKFLCLELESGSFN
jgi:GST-like protein